MKELSLHILDIVQNSVSAQATLIEILIDEQHQSDILRIVITDNGRGIPPDILKTVTDPFTTTRTTRKVGLGIPLFKDAAESTGGKFSIRSTLGVGTVVEADFVYSHIDRQPVGNMADTVSLLVLGNPHIDFVYTYIIDDQNFVLDTREIRETLGPEVPLDTPDVVEWIKGTIEDYK